MHFSFYLLSSCWLLHEFNGRSSMIFSSEEQAHPFVHFKKFDSFVPSVLYFRIVLSDFLLICHHSMSGLVCFYSSSSHAMGRYPAFAPQELHQAKIRVAEETIICHSEPASFSSTESSDGGKVL